EGSVEEGGCDHAGPHRHAGRDAARRGRSAVAR
ncbi:MAG: hypothetical protein AVDCRST_MAG33-13, partial [uncultured Thermomicrobiales bacterium]